jgi:hypothetical protein
VKVIHSYTMVELTRAERGDKRKIIMWTERKGKSGGRLEE